MQWCLAGLARKAARIALATPLYLRLGVFGRGRDRRFVEGAYRRVLGRPADEPTLAAWLRVLEGGAPRRTVVNNLLLTDFMEKLHMLRRRVVCGLPAAQVILDLGGATPDARQGCLLEMGYPHAASEVTIVDVAAPTGGRAREWLECGPTRVRTLSQSMADPLDLGDTSVDLVWAGQSIEHVTPEEAAHVLREVWRVLRPGGWFCLDTPNRRLTSIQSPHEFIHPEHQVEYTPAQLETLLRDANFEDVTLQGVAPLPLTARTGIFLPWELSSEAPLSNRVDLCYVIYACARKPARADPLP